MTSTFRLSVFIKGFIAAIVVVVLVLFVPAFIERLRTNPPPAVGATIIAALFFLLIEAFMCWMLFYKIAISGGQITVTMFVRITQFPIEQVRSFEHVMTFLPMYVFGIDRGLSGRTVRMVLGVHGEVAFMALLKERNPTIQFSRWNQRRIARFLERSSDSQR